MTATNDSIVKPRRGTIASRYLEAIIGNGGTVGSKSSKTVTTAPAAAARTSAATADNATMSSFVSGMDCSLTASTAVLNQSESWTTVGTRFSSKTPANGGASRGNTPTRRRNESATTATSAANVDTSSKQASSYNPHSAVNTTTATASTTTTSTLANSRPNTPVTIQSTSSSRSGSTSRKSYRPPPGTSTLATSIMGIDSSEEESPVLEFEVEVGSGGENEREGGGVTTDSSNSLESSPNQLHPPPSHLSIEVRNPMNCSSLSQISNAWHQSGAGSGLSTPAQSQSRSTSPTNFGSNTSNHSHRSSSGSVFPRTGPTAVVARPTTPTRQLSNPYGLKRSPNATSRLSTKQEPGRASLVDDDDEDGLAPSSVAGAPTEVMTNRTSDVLTRVRDKLVAGADGALQGPPQVQRTHWPPPPPTPRTTTKTTTTTSPAGSRPTTPARSRPTTPNTSVHSRAPTPMHSNHRKREVMGNNKSSMKEMVVPSLLDAQSDSMSMSIAPENDSFDMGNAPRGSTSAANPLNAAALKIQQSLVLHQNAVNKSRLLRHVHKARQTSLLSPSASESASFQSLNTRSNSLGTGGTAETEASVNTDSGTGGGASVAAESTTTSFSSSLDDKPSISSVKVEPGSPDRMADDEEGQNTPVEEKTTAPASTLRPASGGGGLRSMGRSASRVAALAAHLRRTKWTVRGAHDKNQDQPPPQLQQGEGEAAGPAPSPVAGIRSNAAYQDEVGEGTTKVGKSVVIQQGDLAGRGDDDESTLPEERIGFDRAKEFVVYNQRPVQNAKAVFQSKSLDQEAGPDPSNERKKETSRRETLRTTSGGGEKSPIQPLFSLDRLDLSQESEKSPIRKNQSMSKASEAISEEHQDEQQQSLQEEHVGRRHRSKSLSKSLELKLSKETCTAVNIREALARNRPKVEAQEPEEDDMDNCLDEELVHIMETIGKADADFYTAKERPSSAPSTQKRSKTPTSNSHSDHQRNLWQESKGTYRPTIMDSRSVRDKIRAFNQRKSTPTTQTATTFKSQMRSAEITPGYHNALPLKQKDEEEKKEDDRIDDRITLPSNADRNDNSSVKSLREKIQQEFGGNRMPSPIANDDDYSVHSLRDRIEQKINEQQDAADEDDDDNSVRSLREKFEAPASKQKGDNVSSLRAMFESKPKSASATARPGARVIRRIGPRPQAQERVKMDSELAADDPKLAVLEKQSVSAIAEENNTAIQRSTRAMDEATALLGAYRARERKREIEASMRAGHEEYLVDIAAAAGPEQSETTAQGLLHARQYDTARGLLTTGDNGKEFDQWSSLIQNERTQNPTRAAAAIHLEEQPQTGESAMGSARQSQQNHLYGVRRVPMTIHSNGDQRKSDAIFRGEACENSSDDDKNLVPGSHWTSKGKPSVHAKMPQQSDAKGASTDSEYSDAVTLDASIAEVSILTNPSAIRSKASREVDEGDRQSDTSSSAVSIAKKSEASSSQLSEAAAPLLAASMHPMSDEMSRDPKRGDMSTLTEAAKSSVEEQRQIAEADLLGEDLVDTQSEIHVHDESIPESGEPWVAFQNTATAEVAGSETHSLTISNWPDFGNEKEWAEDSDGNFIPASSLEKGMNSPMDQAPMNPRLGPSPDVVPPLQRSFPDILVTARMEGAKSPISHHSRFVPPRPESTSTRQIQPVRNFRPTTPTDQGNLQFRHDYNPSVTGRSQNTDVQSTGSGSTFLSFNNRSRLSDVRSIGSTSTSRSVSRPRTSDYEPPRQDYGPPREYRTDRTVASPIPFFISSPPVVKSPAVPALPSPLDPDYDTIMSSRHKMLLSRQRALQHRRATRERSSTPPPPSTQSGFFGRTHPERSQTPDPPPAIRQQLAVSPRSVHSTRSAPSTSPAVSPRSVHSARSAQSAPRSTSTPAIALAPRFVQSTPKPSQSLLTNRSSPTGPGTRQHAASETTRDTFGFPMDDSDEKAFEALTRPSRRSSRDPDGTRASPVPNNLELAARRTVTTTAAIHQQRNDCPPNTTFYSRVKSRLGLAKQQRDLSQSEAVVARISAVRAARLRRLHAYGDRGGAASTTSRLAISQQRSTTTTSPQQQQHQHANISDVSPSIIPGYRYYTHDVDNEPQQGGGMEEDMSTSTNSNAQEYAANLAVD